MSHRRQDRPLHTCYIFHHPSPIVHHPSSIIYTPYSVNQYPWSIIHKPSSNIHHWLPIVDQLFVHRTLSINHHVLFSNRALISKKNKRLRRPGSPTRVDPGRSWVSPLKTKNGRKKRGTGITKTAFLLFFIPSCWAMGLKNKVRVQKNQKYKKRAQKTAKNEKPKVYALGFGRF